MTMSPEQILKEIRALPADERLRVVEQVVHEVAREVTPPAPIVQTSGAIWTDETDAEFETFQKTVQELRGADVWRAADG